MMLPRGEAGCDRCSPTPGIGAGSSRVAATKRTMKSRTGSARWTAVTAILAAAKVVAAIVGGAWVIKIDLHQKTIQLGVRQIPGTVMLNGVLGGHHEEWRRQAVAVLPAGYQTLLHRLK